MTTTIMPNDPVAATDTPAVASLDSIAQKMTVMRELTLRNQMRATENSAPGAAESDSASPVVPNEPKITSDEDRNIDSIQDSDAQDQEEQSPEPVSEDETSNSTNDELIDFLEFADTNPNAKFKFMRNGKQVVIDAKKAASILGQGGAIHEEARQLKIQRAEFDEYSREHRARQEGLTLAMEFTVQPQLQQAYDEIVKTQQYQSTFQQQLNSTQDPGAQARIRANMQQNERYIQSQSQVINQLKPAVESFYDLRRQQVSEVLENSRKSFQDKELKNEYIYNELRDKIGRLWKSSNNELVPGVKNIDLVTSDETLLGLVRDGLKFRDRPTARQAGSSIAAVTQNKRTSPFTSQRGTEDSIEKLREQANTGDKRTRERAGDNLLMAQLSRLKASRSGR
jgi:hypothetical protein